MNVEARLAQLERRMHAFESIKKRKVDDLDEDENMDELMHEDADLGAGGVSTTTIHESEEILKGVLRHSKPSGEFEWARKQINLTQTDPADLDQYFTALIASLVVHGYMDSYTAWLNRFVVPVPPTGILKGRAIEAYVSKNLLVMLNLQPLGRGRAAKDVAIATLRKRSTYEKVLECARMVSRGENLSYEPSPAALQLETPPKRTKSVKKTVVDDGEDKKSSAGTGDSARKKKLFAQKPLLEEEDGSDATEGGEDASDASDEPDEDVFEPFVPAQTHSGASVVMEEKDDSENSDVEEDSDADVDATQMQPATQATQATQATHVEESVPVVDLQKVSVAAVDEFFMPVVAAPPTNESSVAPATSLRQRFMAKKIITSSLAAAVHPMMQESTPMEWEPLDVNRRSMVQTPTGAWDSYLNWRKAFEADPRFENRYVEYTRPNGERSSMTGYYVRFFNAWPSIVCADEFASMSAQKADSMYVRWLQSLSTTKSTEEIREKLL